MKEVYASWYIKGILGRVLAIMSDEQGCENIYISCGAGEDQFEGFFPEPYSPGSKITIEYVGVDDLDNDFFKVTFSCLTNDFEIHRPDYWLSPSVFNHQTFEVDRQHESQGEAAEWGIR